MKRKILTNTFGWLFIGLLVCFSVSYISTLNEQIFMLLFGGLGGYMYLIYVIAELLLVIFLSARINKMSPLVAKISYILYSMLTGLSLSGIFIVYTKASLSIVFLLSAFIFGIFTIIGKTTKMDLTKWSTFLFVTIITIIIFEIVNIFLLSSTLNTLLSIAGVVVFAAYTAYDIKWALEKSSVIKKENRGLYCAFQLLIDFINIFIDLLRLFGRNKD